jgi:glycosyltransferase involved in cell wall biosynthesis
VIAVIGEVCARKAQHRLVEALPQVIRAGIDPLVLLMGSVLAPYRSTLERTIHEARMEERVRVLGMRNDIPDLLAAADCGCLPSQREVMPISILEGMSIGLPFIATDVGGVRDCIRDGIDGIIVPRKQPLALTTALIRLGSDESLRRTMGLNAQQRIGECFSPEACVPQILNCYSAACA